jgi:hypothetical protein
MTNSLTHEYDITILSPSSNYESRLQERGMSILINKQERRKRKAAK